MPYWNGTESVFTGKGWAVVDDWRPWREAAASVKARAMPGDFVMFPEESRALTARSMLPYLDEAFMTRLFSAPPTGRAWWVSQVEDVPPGNEGWVKDEETFGQLVVQQLERPARFQEFPLVNASFEDGFKGWDKPGNAAQWSREEEWVVDGSASAGVTLRQPRFARLRSTPFGVTPGKLYRVTAYVKDPTIGFYTVSPQLFVNFYADSDTPPRRTRLATLLPSDRPGWMLMVNDGIIPADAKDARIEFLFREYANALGPTSYVDDVRVWLEQ
jgi:hypothetical protein